MADLPKFEDIPVTEIAVKTRTRSVSRDAVAVLRQSYEDHGGFTTPIHVRKAKTGFELIDGAHRLTLARDLGLETILARIWHCSQEEARFFETDANLALAHLTPVALARSLAVRHEAYLNLHPGTAPGVAGGKARQNQQTTEMSFADFVGAVMGVTPRQVQRIVRAGRALMPDQAQALEAAPKRVTMDDLYVISKIGEAGERSFVIDTLARGGAPKAAAARKLWKAEQGMAPEPLTNTDQTLMRLMDAWRRAPKIARRRFLEEKGGEVQALLDEMRDD
jgi:ParB family transcriptional regulator, chromosome partitioning protein